MTISPTLAVIIGTVLMVATDILHNTSGFLPASWVAVATGVIAAATWVSVHLLHTKAVKAAVNAAVKVADAKKTD